MLVNIKSCGQLKIYFSTYYNKKYLKSPAVCSLAELMLEFLHTYYLEVDKAFYREFIGNPFQVANEKFSGLPLVNKSPK